MFDKQSEAAAPVRPATLRKGAAGAGGRGGSAGLRGRAIRRVHNGVWYELRPAANGTFYIHWSEQRRSRRESTREKEVSAASAYFDEWLKLLDAPRRGEVLTIADLWQRRFADSPRHRGMWGHLEPVFGHLTPGDVSQELVDDYVTRRSRVARPGTIRLEVLNLAAVWKAAVKARILSFADVPQITLPPDSPPRDRWLRDDEIDRLLTAAKGGERLTRVERFCWIALDACARRAAIETLRWDNGQVDFEMRLVHFNPPGRAQTSKHRASVPMSDRLHAVLLRAYEERSGPWVLDTPGAIYEPLVRVAKLAGLEGVHPHVLRHTAATHMARRGVSLWVIANLLGNSLAQVEKVYAKWAPGFGREAVETIGGTHGREVGTSAQNGRHTRPTMADTAP